MISKLKSHLDYKKVIAILFFLSPLFILAFIVKDIPQEEIKAIIKEAGPWGPVIYMAAMLLTFIIAPLNGSAILFAGFYAFHSMVVWWTLIAATIASITNFWIARLWGRGLVTKLVGKSNMQKVDKLEHEYGVAMLVLLRFFQGGIHEFVSYAAGLTTMKFSTYFTVSTLTAIPGSVLWYFLAEKTESAIAFLALNFTLTIIFSAIFVVAVFLLKAIRENHGIYRRTSWFWKKS